MTSLVHAVLAQADRNARAATQALGRAQRPNGEFAGCPRLLEGYYKSPLAFAWAKCPERAERALSWILEVWRHPPAFFRERRGDSGVARHVDLYQHFWVCLGAWGLGRARLAKAAFRFSRGYLNPDHGGFASSVLLSREPLVCDARSTAMGGLVALALGRLDIARRAGGFLLELRSQQPDLSRGFYLRRGPDGNLITSSQGVASRLNCVSRGDREPLHYAFGLAASLLACLHRETGEGRYLRGAVEYVRLAQAHGARVLQERSSGKLAWALALLYAAEGDRNHLSDCGTIMSSFWERCQVAQTGIGGLEALDRARRFDWLAECVVWSGVVASALRTASRGLARSQLLVPSSVGRSSSASAEVVGAERKVSAVIFDMDGVVLNSSWSHARAWRKVAGPIAPAISAGYFLTREGARDFEIAAGIARLGRGALAPRQVGELAKRKALVFEREFARRVSPVRGTIRILRDLSGKQMRIALVTGAPRRTVERALKARGLWTFFKVVVTGDDVETGKPSPAPYLKAVRMLRLDVEDCIVVENAPLGIMAALRCGIRCVAVVTSLPVVQLQAADEVCGNLQAVSACLAAAT